LQDRRSGLEMETSSKRLRNASVQKKRTNCNDVTSSYVPNVRGRILSMQAFEKMLASNLS
jgi:hypothetical protein